MKINPESLARASSRHPWRVIGVWGVLFLSMGAVSAALLGGVLNNDISFTNRPESIKAQEIIDEQFSAAAAGAGTEYVIVQSDALTVDEAEYESFVADLQATLAAESDLVATPPTTYYDALQASPEAAAGLVSKDQHYTLIPVAITEDATATIEGLREVLDANTSDGFTTQLAGQATMNADFTTIAEEDARKGESIGIMVALVVLVVVFGAIIAALVPIGMAIVAIGIALGITALVGQIVEFNLFVSNIISMIGLAVGIDYSLFIVSRFREERKKGFEKLEAIGAAGATANRAVFFSGMTVVLALLGMFIIPTTIFRALAAGAIFVTLVSIASSMTLLPAVLAKLGDRTDWPGLSRIANVVVMLAMVVLGGVVAGALSAVGAPSILVALAAVATIIGSSVWLTKIQRRGSWAFLDRFVRHEGIEYDVRGGFWDVVTRSVMKRPWVFLITSVLILGGLASFYFQIEQGQLDQHRPAAGRACEGGVPDVGTRVRWRADRPGRDRDHRRRRFDRGKGGDHEVAGWDRAGADILLPDPGGDRGRRFRRQGVRVLQG